MQTGAKLIPYVRIKKRSPYPVAHTHIAHIREPPRSAVSKLLLILDGMLVGRVQIRKFAGHYEFVIIPLDF